MQAGHLRALGLALSIAGCAALGCADLIGLGNLGRGTGGESSGGNTSSGGTLASPGGQDAGSGGDPAGGASSEGTAGLGGDGGTSLGGGDGYGGEAPDCAIDEFEDELLTAACWHTFNENKLFGEYSVDEEAGILVLRPDVGTSWFNGDSAFLLYREVEGNFLLEVQFSVFAGDVAQTDPTHESYPMLRYVNGGIVAFPALQAFEDIEGPFTGYYAIKAGALRDFGEGQIWAGFKADFTVDDDDDMTTIAEADDPGGWRDLSLRMCRIGDLIWTGFKDNVDTEWHQLHAGDHHSAGYDTTDSDLPDLTGTMYVGLPGELWDPDATSGEVRIVYSRAAFSVPKFSEDCQE